MSVWHKTLFYLGLVDEEAEHPDEPYDESEPPEYPGAPRRTQQPAAPLGGRRQVRPPLEEWGTGEQAPVGRGDHMGTQRRGVQGRRVEPPMTTRRRTTTDRALSDSGVVVQSSERSMVRPISDADLESEVIVARSYSDAQTLADHLRASVPVVLDLRKVEPAMVRRLVDFSSGLTYALGGSMRKIGQGVVLVTPANVNITREERRRLRQLGYYEEPEEF